MLSFNNNENISIHLIEIDLRSKKIKHGIESMMKEETDKIIRQHNKARLEDSKNRSESKVGILQECKGL